MTLALILAARETNPSDYDDDVDIIRGVFEVASLCCMLYNAIVEVSQLKRWVYLTCKHGY